MSLICNARNLVIAIGLCLGTLAPSLAQEMVSIKGSTVNMRAGPSINSAVLWELDKGYPLQVIKRKGNWLQVRDFENDRGWVARSLTHKVPYYIVKASVANVRRGPGMQHRIVGKAEQVELLRTREKKGNWVRVERNNGPSGWIAKSLLWGW
jgi:SH3-like domain-containing protein